MFLSNKLIDNKAIFSIRLKNGKKFKGGKVDIKKGNKL